jgi:hypothetical protein
MTQPHFLGVAKGADGRIAPVFAPPGAALDALAHHRSVVDALRRGPFLPAAFGAGVDCDLGARVKAKATAIEAALGESRDLIEMGVSIQASRELNAPAGAPVTGRDFLRQAAQRAGSAESAAVALDTCIRHITGLGGVSRCKVLSQADGHTVLAVAVERSCAPAVAEAIEAQSGPAQTIEVSGPWPLYSFGLCDILGAEAAA